MIRFVNALALLIAGVCAATSGFAQTRDAASYPVKPVRIVVGFVPGGGADIPGRILAS